MSRGLGALTALLLGTLSTTALASGYGLRESTVDGMGVAYAGSAAQSGDASYMANNPAALAGVETTDAAVNFIAIFVDSETSYSTSLTAAGTPTGGPSTVSGFVNDAYVPAGGFRMRLSERWAFGVSVSAPWGLSTDYPSDWAGRYYALKTDLKTINIAPIVSYEVSPNVAVAAGLQTQYAWGTLTSAIDFGTLGAMFSIPGSVPGAFDGKGSYEADDWGLGFLLGLQARISENATFGISYRSSISHTMQGDLRFRLDSAGIGSTISGATGMFTNTEADTKLTTPDVVNAGLRVRLSERWTGLVGVDWVNWSRFKALVVNAANPFQPDEVTTARWEDSWFFAAGAEYAASESWTWRAGVAWDETPVPDSTREPRIPDNGRLWVSLGATWHASENCDVKFAYAHLFLDDSRVNPSPADPANAFRGTIDGRVSIDADVVGVALAWRM
jgi:long-chain fatty acid transport protein